MPDNIIFVTDNIAVVPAQESICLVPLTISAKDLEKYYGTVSLPIAQSEAIVEDQFTNFKILFGSWIEGGEEDKHLEELYKSRGISSKIIK